jgi:hypothetical protein
VPSAAVAGIIKSEEQARACPKRNPTAGGIRMTRRTTKSETTKSNTAIAVVEPEDTSILWRPEEPFSIYKAEQSEPQTNVTVEPEVESQVEVEPQTEVETQVETPSKPTTRRCPSHHKHFADEEEMRPLTEFRYNKTTGKLQNTYCKRCQSKLHATYAKERRIDAHTPSLRDQVAELQQKLSDTQQQLEYAEAQVAQLEALLHDAAVEPQPAQ